MNLTEAQELLEVDESVMADMLSAVGWEENESFTDTQQEVLLGMKEAQVEHDCTWLESYYRYIGKAENLSDDEFSAIGQAITDSGQELIGFRGEFVQICQQVKAGADPVALICPQLLPVDQVLPSGQTVKEFIKAAIPQAGDAIVEELLQMAVEAKKIRDNILPEFRQGLTNYVGNKVLSSEFKSVFLEKMNAELEGDGEGKKQSLTGVQTPTKLLSSSNSLDD